MALPVIGYKTMLRSAGGTISDPGTDTGFSIANLSDFKTFLLWKSNGTAAPITIDIDLGVSNTESANYLALLNHNLKTLGATIQILGDAFTPPTTVRQAAFTPTEDTVSYKNFNQAGPFRYWRIVINHAAPPFAAKPYVGELFLGVKTSLPEYISADFDPFFKQVAAQGARSPGGHYLGVLLRGQKHRAEISFGDAGGARTAFTSDINPFLDNHAFKRYPFIFVLDEDDADFKTPRYVKLTDDAEVPRKAVGGVYSLLGLTLPVEEAYAEPA